MLKNITPNRGNLMLSKKCILDESKSRKEEIYKEVIEGTKEYNKHEAERKKWDGFFRVDGPRF